jgi:hypothetical protein
MRELGKLNQTSKIASGCQSSGYRRLGSLYVKQGASSKFWILVWPVFFCNCEPATRSLIESVAVN